MKDLQLRSNVFINKNLTPLKQKEKGKKTGLLSLHSFVNLQRYFNFTGST